MPPKLHELYAYRLKVAMEGLGLSMEVQKQKDSDKSIRLKVETAKKVGEVIFWDSGMVYQSVISKGKTSRSLMKKDGERVEDKTFEKLFDKFFGQFIAVKAKK